MDGATASVVLTIQHSQLFPPTTTASVHSYASIASVLFILHLFKEVFSTHSQAHTNLAVQVTRGLLHSYTKTGWHATDVPLQTGKLSLIYFVCRLTVGASARWVL